MLPELRAQTPLFRANGRAMRVSQVRDVVKSLMGGVGADPRNFGAHSLRIGGATAGLAAGFSEAQLRAAGRWSSDVYALYARASQQALRGMAKLIGSTPFEDLERGEFVDEELSCTTVDINLSRSARGEMPGVEQDLIDDALASDGDEDGGGDVGDKGGQELEQGRLARGTHWIGWGRLRQASRVSSRWLVRERRVERRVCVPRDCVCVHPLACVARGRVLRTNSCNGERVRRDRDAPQGASGHGTGVRRVV